MTPTMRRVLSSLFSLAWLLPLASPAPAQRSGYPSLAPRAVESRDRESEVKQEPLVPAAPDAALGREVAALAERARTAAAAFDGLVGTTVARVDAAGSSGVGTEAWVVAEQAISALQAARYDSVAALATLDTLYAQRAANEDVARAAADLAVIAAARAPVVAIVDSQNDRLDALGLRLAAR